jgi:uncharacterized membrane protein
LDAKRIAPAVSKQPHQHGLTPGRHLLRWIGIAVGCGIAVLVAMPAQFSLLSRLLIAWDVALLILLSIQWIIIGRTNPQICRARASEDDPGNIGILLVIVLASMLALGGAVFMLHGPDPLVAGSVYPVIPGIVLVTVAGGWLLISSTYTLHYARLYYGEDDEPGGLIFPSGSPDSFTMPDDKDFAYLSFTVGMTFQVSDVQVTTSRMRRAILVQALVSFVYNLAILALVINVIAGRI